MVHWCPDIKGKVVWSIETALLCDGTVSVATLVRAEPPMLAEITRLEAHEKELSTPSALRGLIEPGADIAHRWEPAPMSTRREITCLLLIPDLIGELRLQPFPTTRTPPHTSPRTHPMVARITTEQQGNRGDAVLLLGVTRLCRTNNENRYRSERMGQLFLGRECLL